MTNDTFRSVITAAGLLSMLSLMLLLPFSASAQKLAGDYEIGIGVTYGFDLVDETESGEIGMNVNGYYSITDEIRLGMDFTYYLPTDEDFADAMFYEWNFNTNFHLINHEVLRLYTILGFQVVSYDYEMKSRAVDVAGKSRSGSDIGLNMGGGLELNFDSIILYVEPKYSLNGFDQLSLSAGGRLFF